jgi:hypothetical protein
MNPVPTIFMVVPPAVDPIAGTTAMTTGAALGGVGLTGGGAGLTDGAAGNRDEDD